MSNIALKSFYIAMSTIIQHLQPTTTPGRRTQLIVKLIEAFQSRDMSTDDVRQFLDLKISTAQKYVRELRDAGLLIVNKYLETTSNSLGSAVYRLSDNAEKVHEFMDEILKAKVKRSGRSRLRLLQTQDAATGMMTSASGHRIHILADDVPHPIRTFCAPVKRDPLVEALFGAAKSDNKCSH